MKNIFIIPIFFFCVFSSWAVDEKQAASIVASAQRDIDAANAGWLPAMRKHDAVAIPSAYAVNGIFITPDGKSVEGKDAIQKMYEERFKTSGSKILSGSIVKDGTTYAGDRIYEWGHAYFEAVAADPGSKPVKKGGAYLTVWEKGSDSHWYISRNLAFK